MHETRQRNAELALINSVQDAIAGELDTQAIYDAVGDRIQEIFDAQVVNIRTLDEATGLIHAPYIIERGGRLQEEPRSPVGFSKHVVETGESVLIVENLEAERERYGSPVLWARRRSWSCSSRSLPPAADGRDLAPERRPGARLRRVGPAAAGDAGGQS